MTATVEGVSGNIPIHYHCDPESGSVEDDALFESAYPNDLDEGGSQAFAVDDEVVVMYRRNGDKSPLIIAHSDQVKMCCNFKFTISGEDAGELTEGVFFSIFNEEQTSQPITGLEYDEDQGCWVFSLDTKQEEVDCVGPYWAKFFAAGFKSTQYQGVTSGFFGEESRVILGDGTLYLDTLEKLVGKTGYWEDWSEGICGKNDWSWLLVYAQGGGSYEREVTKCTEPPINLSAGSTTASLVLTGEVYSTLAYTVQDDYNISTAFASIGIGGNIPWSPGKKFILNFASVPTGSRSGDPEWSHVDARMELNFGGEDETYDLYLYFVFENWEGSGSQALMDTYSHEGDKFVWMGDDVVEGEDLVINFSDPRFAVPDTIRTLDFMGLYTASSGGGTVGWSIDYIDFPKWEDWDNSDSPDMCKNHPWVISPLWGNVECPINNFPYHIECTNSISSGYSTHDYNMTDGIFSWVGSSTNLNTSHYVYWWTNDEKEMISGITKLKIKFTAEVFGGESEHSNWENLLLLEITWGTGSDNGGYLILADNGREVPWWITDGNHAYIEGGDKEVEFDLTSWGFTEDSKIQDLTFSWYVEYHYEYGVKDTKTMAMTCDYIDFA